jgi:hypothetical protein
VLYALLPGSQLGRISVAFAFASAMLGGLVALWALLTSRSGR